MINTDVTYQHGILNTPFHRVYFNDGITNEENKTVGVETLPRERFKFAVGIHYNYFLSNKIITRLSYRYYIDTFGLDAHTFNIELPFKVTPTISLIPFFRYYTQNKSNYFKPYGTHEVNSKYYTSDYDLSNFSSFKRGIAIRLSPPKGIFRIQFSKKSRLKMHSFEFRYSNYERTTGLKANNYALGTKFIF